MKNKTILILFIVFVIANTLDGVSSYFIRHAEANPIAILTKSMTVLYIIKLGFMFAIGYWCWRNVYPSAFYLYLTVMILLLGSLVFSIGAYTNIYAVRHPLVLEAAAAVPTSEKIAGYISFAAAMYVVPMALSLLGFKLYEWASKNTKIDKQYFKNLKWWQL